MVNNLSSFFSPQKLDNRKKCEKLNTLFPLFTLSQGGIQEEHKSCCKQDAKRAMG